MLHRASVVAFLVPHYIRWVRSAPCPANLPSRALQRSKVRGEDYKAVENKSGDSAPQRRVGFSYLTDPCLPRCFELRLRGTHT
jgi:hypothetical protein